MSLKTELEKGMNILPVILNENNEIVAMYIFLAVKATHNIEIR